MSTCHAVRPCMLFPACFTNPLAPETGDLVTHRDRGSEDSAPYPPGNSPFLRFIFPARLSPESRPQGRLFISINFSKLSSVILIRRPPHRERLRERSANWKERLWCFLHEFLDDAFAEILPRKQRLHIGASSFDITVYTNPKSGFPLLEIAFSKRSFTKIQKIKGALRLHFRRRVFDAKMKVGEREDPSNKNESPEAIESSRKTTF